MRIGNIIKATWDYVVMSFGALLFALGWEAFMIPNNMTEGGVAGACTILQFATGIPMSYSYAVVNGILLVFAFIILGRGVGIRTIFCIVVSSLALNLLSRPAFDFLKCIPGNFFYVDNAILVPVIGAILEALGITIILGRGGSTGGTDILALILNKFWPISLGKVYLVTDFFIVSSIMLVPGYTFTQVLYGFVAMATFSWVIDFVTMGKKSTAQVIVFSRKYQDIADYIINDMERGVTVVKATGWYTKNDSNLLLIYVLKREVHTITKAVKFVDPQAFVAVSPASSVYGEGFEEIKAGMNLKLNLKQDVNSKDECVEIH